MEEYFEIGQIVNTSGLKGILKIKPFTDEVIDLLLSVKETTMQGSPRFIVQSCYDFGKFACFLV